MTEHRTNGDISGDPTPDITEWVDVPTAAERLGISTEAVRQRIKRQTLQSDKRDGRLYVLVDRTNERPDDDPTAYQHRTNEPIDAEYRTADDDDDPGVALMRVDEAFDRLAGLIQRNEELAIEVGTLRERTEHLETENTRLQQRIDQLEAAQSPEMGDSPEKDQSPADGEDKPQTRPWWQFWAW